MHLKSDDVMQSSFVENNKLLAIDSRQNENTVRFYIVDSGIGNAKSKFISLSS